MQDNVKQYCHRVLSKDCKPKAFLHWYRKRLLREQIFSGNNGHGMSAFKQLSVMTYNANKNFNYLHENLLKALLVYCWGGDMQKNYNNILY